MWPVIEPLWLGVALTVLGWVWGSFLNQLVDRMPRRGQARARPHGSGAVDGAMDSRGREQATQPPRVSLLRPLRSICLDCGAGIPWYDNIPVLSFLLLRGACRRCGARIGARTLVMEVATPAGFAGLFLLRLRPGAPYPLPLDSGIAPWLAALEFLLLCWLLLAAALLVERRGLGAAMAGAGASLGLAWLLLLWRM